MGDRRRPPSSEAALRRKNSYIDDRGGLRSREANEDVSCPGIQNGPQLNTKKRPLTPSAAALSRESSGKLPSQRTSAAANQTPTRAFARRFWPQRTKTCRTRTLRAPFFAVPANWKASSTRKPRLKAT